MSSDLSPSRINRLATAIAQVYSQQEKGVNAKEIALLESFLRVLARNDLGNLAASNRFRKLEKRRFADDSTSENDGGSFKNDPIKNQKKSIASKYVAGQKTNGC